MAHDLVTRHATRQLLGSRSPPQLPGSIKAEEHDRRQDGNRRNDAKRNHHQNHLSLRPNRVMAEAQHPFDENQKAKAGDRDSLN